jgi:hypothetical protein
MKSMIGSVGGICLKMAKAQAKPVNLQVLKIEI